LIRVINLLNGQLIDHYKNKTPSLKKYLVNFEFQIQNIISDALGFNSYLKIQKNHSMLML